MAIQVSCDLCGQPVGRWYSVNIVPQATYDWQNVADMLTFRKKYALCQTCLAAVLAEMKRIAKEGEP